jgi:predicted alpha/beta-fold hydrolase
METTRIAGVIDRVQIPLVLLSDSDDPAVTHGQFLAVKKAAFHNSWVVSYETPHGGHFAFDTVYGKDYLGQIIRFMLNQEMLLRLRQPMSSFKR